MDPDGHELAAQPNNVDMISNYILPTAFVDDPAAFLATIACQQPSRQKLAILAGPIAKWFIAAAPKKIIDSISGNNGGTAATMHPAVHVAIHYLRAAAVQLRGDSQFSGAVEQEMIQTKHQYEVLEAVGAAATLCRNRTAISSTGILPTLAQLTLQAQSTADVAMFLGSSSSSLEPTLSVNETKFSSSSTSYPPLQQAGVEFLQCAILAEHYRYAIRFVEGTWPRPNSTVNIKTVLRYYYLRGLAHLGCGDYVMAHRCWWTCLSVPAEACSAIMVAAWKKLSMVQPLLDRTRGLSNTYNTGKEPSATYASRFPKSMAKAMGRFINKGQESGDGTILLYTQLGAATEMGKQDIVQSLIETHEAVLKDDGNYGLAHLCLQRVQHNLVWEAAQLFSVASVDQLAYRWKILSEQVPQRLVDSQVPCRIDDDGMVVFPVESTKGEAQKTSSPSSWVDLLEWMRLLEHLQQLDRNISLSSKYHTLMKREEKGIGNPGVERAKPTGMGVEDF